MSSREVVVLGTASQVPTRRRAHHALLVLWDDLGVLFDPGEGTQRQLTLAGIATSRIDQICLTHFHGDHCLGLPGVVQRMALDGPRPPAVVAYPASGQRFFDRLRYASIFQDRDVTRAVPVDAAGVIGNVGLLEVTAEPLDHRVETFGYRLQEPDGWRMLPERLAELGVLGPDVGRLQAGERVRVGGHTIEPDAVRVRRPGQAVAVVMDTRPCEGARRLADGVDLLVCESTFLEGEADLADEAGHMTARDAGALAATADVGRLVLTHFSQRYDDPAAFAAEAGEVFDGEIVVCEDLDRIPVPPRR